MTPLFNNYKKVITLILFLFGLKSYSQDTVSIQKAIETTLSRNIQIKIAQLNQVYDADNLKQAQNNKLPDLFSNNQGYSYYGRSIDPSTNQYADATFLASNMTLLSKMVLYQGGMLRGQILENKLLLEADQTNIAKIKNDLTLRVIETYLQALANQDILKANEQQIDIINQVLIKLQKNIELGNNKTADLTQLKAQLANAELNKTNAQRQLGLSLLALKQYMEFDAAKEICIARPDVDKITNIKVQYNASEAFATALSINPDIKLARLHKQAAYQNINVNKSLYYPSIMLFAGVNSNYSSALKQLTDPNYSFQPIGYIANNPSQQVLALISQPIYGKYPFTTQLKDHLNEALGITLQIPIFNKSIAKTSVHKAEVSYQISEYNEQLAKDNLGKVISQAIFDLTSADKKYTSTWLTYQANKDAYEIMQERYTLGQVNVIDYNIALGNLNKAESDMIESRYELIFRSKVIDYYIGASITL